MSYTIHSGSHSADALIKAMCLKCGFAYSTETQLKISKCAVLSDPDPVSVQTLPAHLVNSLEQGCSPGELESSKVW